MYLARAFLPYGVQLWYKALERQRVHHMPLQIVPVIVMLAIKNVHVISNLDVSGYSFQEVALVMQSPARLKSPWEPIFSPPGVTYMFIVDTQSSLIN